MRLPLIHLPDSLAPSPDFDLQYALLADSELFEAQMTVTDLSQILSMARVCNGLSVPTAARHEGSDLVDTIQNSLAYVSNETSALPGWKYCPDARRIRQHFSTVSTAARTLTQVDGEDAFGASHEVD